MSINLSGLCTTTILPLFFKIFFAIKNSVSKFKFSSCRAILFSLEGFKLTFLKYGGLHNIGCWLLVVGC